MHDHKGFLKTLLGLVLFFALASAGLLLLRSVNRTASVILTNDLCAPPCWGGITPGQTGADEAYALLGEIHGVPADGIMPYYGRDDSLVSYQWVFQPPLPDNLGTIHCDGNMVTGIEILTIGSLTLQESLALLGEPTLLWSRPGRGENNRTYQDVFLLNPARGYRLELVIDEQAGGQVVAIQPNTPVFGVLYFDPPAFDQLLAQGSLIDAPGHAFPQEFTDWLGYGDLEVPGE